MKCFAAAHESESGVRREKAALSRDGPSPLNSSWAQLSVIKLPDDIKAKNYDGATYALLLARHPVCVGCEQTERHGGSVS
jgi:hypothetical protein